MADNPNRTIGGVPPDVWMAFTVGAKTYGLTLAEYLAVLISLEPDKRITAFLEAPK